MRWTKHSATSSLLIPATSTAVLMCPVSCGSVPPMAARAAMLSIWRSRSSRPSRWYVPPNTAPTTQSDAPGAYLSSCCFQAAAPSGDCVSSTNWWPLAMLSSTASSSSEHLLHDARLQLHPPVARDGRVDVVVPHAVLDQPDAADLRADLHHAAALDPEVLDDRDGVAVLEHVADGVLDHRRSAR